MLSLPYFRLAKPKSNFSARRVRVSKVETLERRDLLVAEGELFQLTRNVDTSGLVGAIESSVQWGDGTESAATVNSSGSTGNLRVVIDYSLDTSNFFSTAQRRATLQAAADSLVQRFTDDLAAINPSGGNTWVPAVFDPATGATRNLPSSLSVPSNQLIIFAGGRDFPGNQVGEGAGGFFTNASGSQAWLDTVRARGETGALSAAPSDIGPWGGSIAFDTLEEGQPRNWYFGTDVDGLEADQNDFFSVAVHELAHVLGFGIVFPGAAATSWETHLSGNRFVGPRARAVHGGDVPLSSTSHWENGLQSDGRETAMDPSLTRGTRKLFTPLDFAAMDDIGWSLASSQVTVTASHVYGDNGSYPVALTVRGSRAGELHFDQVANVTNVAPQATVVGAQAVIVGEVLSIPDVVTIRDPGFRVTTTSPSTAETFEVTIDWGDGTAEERATATIDQHGNASRPTLASLNASHIYAAAGNYTVRVTVRDDDSGQDVETFSVVVSPPPQLSLELDRLQVSEDAGDAAAVLTVRRSGPVQATAQGISLQSSDTSEIELPASVQIPAGESFATVEVRAVDDELLDGPQTVQLSASAAGLQAAAIDLLVQDIETLTAFFSAESILESAPQGSLELTVRRSNLDRQQEVAVQIAGGVAAQIGVPTQVVIPVGLAAVTVPITTIDDDLPEPTLDLQFTITAAGYQAAGVELAVLDDEPPLFQNPVDRFDVDSNGKVDAFDALQIIFQLNRRGPSVLLDPQLEQPSQSFFDVDGDYRLNAVDALAVINRMNQILRENRAASGEAAADRNQGFLSFAESEDERRRRLADL